MPALNDRFTGTVRDITSEGAGVVEHASGQVFFVPGVWRGETAEFRVTGFKKRTGFAELVTLLEASPDRVQPLCPHQGLSARHCGGCPWQFVTIEAQLQEKEARVKRAMARLGIEHRVLPIWPSAQPFGYRNRAQLKSDGRQLGYVSAKSNQLVAIADCPVLTEKNRETLRGLLASLPNPALRPGKKQQWTTVDIDEDVTLDSIAVNRRRPFRQANSGQNQRMQDWLAGRLATADKTAPVLELFAGSGNFTEVIAAGGFPQVVAVEAVEDAIAALQARALPNVRAEVGNLFDETVVKRLARANAAAGTLVLDPPRDGFSLIAPLLEGFARLDNILYVSCDLATFARDLQVIQARGFVIEEIQPLDQFPHTPHVEILAFATTKGS